MHLYKDIAEQIILISQKLSQKNLLAAADGNISYRISNQEILITPSGFNKSFISPSDLSIITIENQIISGNPSSERLMHLEVYRKCPDARAIVHAHPPTAIAWSVAFPELNELPSGCLSEVILAVGQIPIIPYARPSTQDMGEFLLPYLPDCRVMILARHGALSWGEDLIEAYNGMERLEHSADILYRAHSLRGQLTYLSNEEIDHLKEMRKKIGKRIL